MKYIKRINEYNMSTVFPGYEFVQDAFQEIIDEDYTVDIDRNGRTIRIFISLFDTRGRVTHFNLLDIIDNINFSIDFLTEYSMDLKLISIGRKDWNDPTTPINTLFNLPLYEKISGVSMIFYLPLRKISVSLMYFLHLQGLSSL